MKITMCFLMALVMTTLAGCSGKYIEVQSQNEIPQGPGMFSGNDGKFSYKKSINSPQIEARGRSLKRPVLLTEPLANEEALFQEFKAFKEFERMKTEGLENAEYNQFQEWLKWKSYQ